MKRAHLIRPVIQWLYLLFCVIVGAQFFLFCRWLSGIGPFHERPPAVEAFLPISALVGLHHLFLTGTWDRIHPAGLTILIAIIFSAFLFRKGFCGWVCPVGTISCLLKEVGQKLGLILRPPRWINLPLSSIKYLLLGFFIYFIFFKMSPSQVEAFLKSPYNIIADIKMLKFFLDPSRITLTILACLVVLSVFVGNFWCRYLCPYGALLGLLAYASPFQIKRDQTTCINCMKCDKTCPMSIEITSKTILRSPECIGCLDCVSKCPVKDSLFLQGPSNKKVWPFIIPLGTIITILIFWLAARATNHWISAIPPEAFKQLYSALF